MNYKCSVLYPESPKAEVLGKLNKSEVREKTIKYPWEAELRKMNSLPTDDVYCNPALEFNEDNSGHGFCIRAVGKPEDYYFSIWYSFPMEKKALFGLFKRTEIELIKKNYSPEEAYSLLDLFLEEDYALLEKRMSTK